MMSDKFLLLIVLATMVSCGQIFLGFSDRMRGDEASLTQQQIGIDQVPFSSQVAQKMNKVINAPQFSFKSHHFAPSNPSEESIEWSQKDQEQITQQNIKYLQEFQSQMQLIESEYLNQLLARLSDGSQQFLAQIQNTFFNKMLAKNQKTQSELNNWKQTIAAYQTQQQNFQSDINSKIQSLIQEFHQVLKVVPPQNQMHFKEEQTNFDLLNNQKIAQELNKPEVTKQATQTPETTKPAALPTVPLQFQDSNKITVSNNGATIEPKYGSLAKEAPKATVKPEVKPQAKPEVKAEGTKEAAKTQEFTEPKIIDKFSQYYNNEPITIDANIVEAPLKAKATETKPADSKPAETKPVDPKPADIKPAGQPGKKSAIHNNNVQGQPLTTYNIANPNSGFAPVNNAQPAPLKAPYGAPLNTNRANEQGQPMQNYKINNYAGNFQPYRPQQVPQQVPQQDQQAQDISLQVDPTQAQSQPLQTIQQQQPQQTQEVADTRFRQNVVNVDQNKIQRVQNGQNTQTMRVTNSMNQGENLDTFKTNYAANFQSPRFMSQQYQIQPENYLAGYENNDQMYNASMDYTTV